MAIKDRPGHAGQHDQPDRPPRRSRPWVLVLAVVVGLAVGIGATVALNGRSGRDRVKAPALDSADPSPPTTAANQGPPPPGASATTPQAAVEGFLTAEINGDLTTSFGFLSATARTGFGSPARWIADHANLVPPVRGYQVEEPGAVGAGDQRAEVVAMVEFEPSLDEVAGLVAERARVTWATTAEEGSWGVDLDATTLEPLYPGDDAAPPAVRTWAESHQACDPAPARTWSGNLQGAPALADQLCGADGAVEVGAVARLASVDSGPFLAAFGATASDWARVVPVTAPVSLKVVVAPIGQEWLVIGVLPG